MYFICILFVLCSVHTHGCMHVFYVLFMFPKLNSACLHACQLNKLSLKSVSVSVCYVQLSSLHSQGRDSYSTCYDSVYCLLLPVTSHSVTVTGWGCQPAQYLSTGQGAWPPRPTEADYTKGPYHHTHMTYTVWSTVYTCVHIDSNISVMSDSEEPFLHTKVAVHSVRVCLSM